jgi:hypothetical protein
MAQVQKVQCPDCSKICPAMPITPAYLTHLLKSCDMDNRAMAEDYLNFEMGYYRCEAGGKIVRIEHERR